MWVLW